jgi:hypothetical protein
MPIEKQVECFEAWIVKYAEGLELSSKAEEERNPDLISLDVRWGSALCKPGEGCSECRTEAVSPTPDKTETEQPMVK